MTHRAPHLMGKGVLVFVCGGGRGKRGQGEEGEGGRGSSKKLKYLNRQENDQPVLFWLLCKSILHFSL